MESTLMESTLMESTLIRHDVLRRGSFDVHWLCPAEIDGQE